MQPYLKFLEANAGEDVFFRVHGKQFTYFYTLREAGVTRIHLAFQLRHHNVPDAMNKLQLDLTLPDKHCTTTRALCSRNTVPAEDTWTVSTVLRLTQETEGGGGRRGGLFVRGACSRCRFALDATRAGSRARILPARGGAPARSPAAGGPALTFQLSRDAMACGDPGARRMRPYTATGRW